MAKYRKKPVIVEATQWFEGDELDGVCRCGVRGRLRDGPHVHTLEGIYPIFDGDWLITGVVGEKYPCKALIFQQTYEPVEKRP